jgi:hypothetical protein
LKILKHVVVAGLIVFLFGGTVLAVYDRAHYLGNLDGYAVGYAVGYKAALNTREPSDELEMACAGLWMGEQHKKYVEREGK